MWRPAVEAYESLMGDLRSGERLFVDLSKRRPDLIDYTSQEISPRAKSLLSSDDYEVARALCLYDLYHLYAASMAEASIWAVTAEMTELAVAAARSMVPETLELTDLPERTAFVHFDTALDIAGIPI